MAETPLQTLLRYMGQEQPKFLPPMQQQPVGDELRQRFMEKLAQQQPPLPPSSQQPTMPPQPGGLPMPPNPREIGRMQMQKLREQAAAEVLGPKAQVPGYQGPSARQLAQQGPTMAAAPSGFDRFMASLRPAGKAAESFISPVDEETGMPNVDIAMGPAGAASRLFGKGLDASPDAARAWRGYRTAATDRYAPIYDIVRGINLPANDDPYIAARVFAGHYGKVQNRLDDLQETLSPFASTADPRKWGEQNTLRKAFKEHAVLERMREQAVFGIDKFPGNMTSGDLIARQKALEATLTTEQLQRIKATEPKLTEFSNSLLAEAQDSGLISKKTHDYLVKKHQKYLPLHVLGGKLEAMEGVGSGSLQVSKPDILFSMTGSNKQVADPVESLVRNTYRIMNQAERNRVAVKIADLSKLPQMQGLVSEVKHAAVLPEGFGKITAWRNGEKHTYALPAAVADAVKAMGREDADLFTKWASKSSAALRYGATTANVGFIPSNAIRDFMTSKVVARGQGSKFTVGDWIGGLASSLKKDQAYRDYLESGASFAGYFQSNQPLKTSAKQMFRGKSLQAAQTISNPLQLVGWIGTQVENAPRIGAYKRAVQEGLDPIEAAYRSRNLTVDFAKAGNITKIANLWVPFLNARMQGSINMGQAFFNSENPAAAWATATSLVGIPAVLTYLHNTRRYPEIYRDIAQFEKDNNFLMVYGDDTDERGNPTQVLKIPKGDIGRTMANPLESYLQFMDGYDPKSMDALFLDMTSDISPIPFSREGQPSLTSVASGIMPPTMKAGAETISGVNFFTGRRIDPIGWELEGVSPKEMYYHDTPKWAVKMSEALAQANINYSPLRIINAVGTQFGGLGRQVADPERAFGTVSGRFVGARGGARERQELDQLNKILTSHADIRAREDRKLEADWARLKDPKVTADERDRILKARVEDGTLPDMVSMSMLEVKTPLERKLERAGQKERIEYIFDYMGRLTPEQAGYVWARWKALKIITKDTQEEIAKMMKEKSGTAGPQ